jgi:hypothetical protein
MPTDPFHQGRRIRLHAERHSRTIERAAARLFEMAQRHGDLPDEQRVRLAEWLRLRGGWTGPRPFNRPRRKGGDTPESGGVPAVPDRPKNLSGGAAAAMEYEED